MQPYEAQFLPLAIRGVHYYKISGRYTYRGDLLITDGCLYFIARESLEEARERSERKYRLAIETALRTAYFVRLIPTLLMFGATALIGVRRATSALRLMLLGPATEVESKPQAWWRQEFQLGGERVAEHELRRALDNYVARARVERRNPLFPPEDAHLPEPERFAREEIRDLKLSSRGELSFYAHSDRHDFAVGRRARDLLHRALKAGRFIF